ncbi:gliding motility lipoprotein GldD [Marinilabilia sp.]|uniref:gliding motility lipoprotein GldD n=1 Tax=Marinilabilia sp. TaxID=2021252 RepID=UPI0025BD8300|nr:gliding motility lipoprotein GldD [Marinilabilia sp.]
MILKQQIRNSIFLLIIIFLFACSNNYAPKPRGYFRISLPEKSYLETDTALPYSFEFPKYARLRNDNQGVNEPYWVNVDFPQFNAKIHISYKPVENNLYQLLEDNRELAFKHTVKADAIKEQLFESPEKNVYGIFYEIEGNTASPAQFFVTDSINHFLRGSLYFNTIPNKDSIAPVLDFVKQDIIHLMETLTWKSL